MSHGTSDGNLMVRVGERREGREERGEGRRGRIAIGEQVQASFDSFP